MQTSENISKNNYITTFTLSILVTSCFNSEILPGNFHADKSSDTASESATERPDKNVPVASENNGEQIEESSTAPPLPDQLAKAQQFDTDSETGVNGTAGIILANIESPSPAQLAEYTFYYKLVRDVSYGTLSEFPNFDPSVEALSITYTPRLDFWGKDNFAYAICVISSAGSEHCLENITVNLYADNPKLQMEAMKERLIEKKNVIVQMKTNFENYSAVSGEASRETHRQDFFRLVDSLNEKLDDEILGDPTEESAVVVLYQVDDPDTQITRTASIQAADFDGDLDYDILHTSEGGITALYRNDSDNVFTDISEESGLRALVPAGSLARVPAWGDYNSDGSKDLYIPIKQGMPNILLTNNGDGTFTQNVGAGVGTSYAWGGTYSFGSNWGDYDKDGHLDLAVARWGGSFPSILFKNNGDGTFTDINAAAGITDVADSGSMPYFVDLNGDNWLDYVIARPASATSRIFINNQDSTFTDFPSPTNFGAYWGLQFFDIDDDSDMDIIGGSQIFENTSPDAATLTFSEKVNDFAPVTDAMCQTSNAPTSAKDIDLDGDLDALIGSWDGTSVGINLNNNHYAYNLITTGGEPVVYKSRCLSSTNLGLSNKPQVKYKSVLHYESYELDDLERALVVVNKEIARIETFITTMSQTR